MGRSSSLLGSKPRRKPKGWIWLRGAGRSGVEWRKSRVLQALNASNALHLQLYAPRRHQDQQYKSVRLRGPINLFVLETGRFEDIFPSLLQQLYRYSISHHGKQCCLPRRSRLTRSNIRWSSGADLDSRRAMRPGQAIGRLHCAQRTVPSRLQRHQELCADHAGHPGKSLRS